MKRQCFLQFKTAVLLSFIVICSFLNIGENPHRCLEMLLNIISILQLCLQRPLSRASTNEGNKIKLAKHFVF